MPILSLNRVSKIYDTGSIQVPALQDISLSIDEGEMVAIIGPSGSGKSTLMNILGLLDRATVGTLHIGNDEVALTMSDRTLAKLRSERIGFVFQSFNLLPHLSALENVRMPTTYTSISKQAARQKAEDLLVKVGLGERMHHKPSELSGGEKQRVAIARALINDPDILLADEPTGNLDSETGKEVLALLQQLHDEGSTIVVITHDNAIAASCQRTVSLLDGRIVASNRRKKGAANSALLPTFGSVVKKVVRFLQE